MRRPFLLGVIIVIVCLASCTSNEDFNNNPSELKEQIVEEVPSQLNGSIEDEALSVSILAEIDADKRNYKTNIVFRNKTEKSLDLVFDCGLLISSDKFASNSGVCLAVESMLLKKNINEKQTIVLPKEFFDLDSKSITVRYRQDKITKDLDIQLKVLE